MGDGVAGQPSSEIATPVLLASMDVERARSFAIINNVPHAFGIKLFLGWHSRDNQREANNPRSLRSRERVSKRGQVAQVVERSPEKAGVGGSTPSLATTF